MRIAITVVGHDRPGIVADVTGALAAHGGNIEDSSMTLLRGHFVWTLLVETDATDTVLEQTLAPLRRPELMISALRLPADESGGIGPSTAFFLSVHGADRTGIVAAITRVIADAGGNLTNLTTRLAGGLYVVGADVDLPLGVDVDSVCARLAAVAGELGVTAHLRPVDSDIL
ncbi:MAG: ACT domain-containing protein [Actinomycetes bacterium]